MTQKEYQQKHIRETIANVQRSADTFKQDRDKVQSEWEKLFKEVIKHSPDFQLKKTPRKQTWQVQPYIVGVDGTHNYSSQRVLVGEISTDYNDMEIVYTGKFPEGDAGRVRVIVEEHKTNPRGSWRTVSHGYKLKVVCGYDDDKKYYKTGRPVVQKVEDYVKRLWDSFNHKQKQAELKSRAFKLAFNKYWGTNTDVEFGGKIFNGISTNYNQIVVRHNNGSVIVLSYYEVNDEVKLKVDRVHVGDNSTDSIVEALGNMK